MRTTESPRGVPCCFQTGSCHTLHHVSQIIRDDEPKEEMWRKQEKGGFGGEEWVMSVLIKWANLQSCGIHEETGHPGGGRDCWKRG